METEETRRQLLLWLAKRNDEFVRVVDKYWFKNRGALHILYGFITVNITINIGVHLTTIWKSVEEKNPLT